MSTSACSKSWVWRRNGSSGQGCGEERRLLFRWTAEESRTGQTGPPSIRKICSTTKKKTVASAKVPRSSSELLDAVGRLRSGLDLPSELFSLLTGDRQFQRAALLMPEESGSSFVPWVYLGIDRTTQHHLRIPKGFLESLPGLDEGTSASVEGGALQPLKGFFSSREFALIKRLIICPFIGGSQFAALLLLVDSEDLPLAEHLDLGPIEAAGPAIAAKINSARSILGTGGPPKRDSALRSRLSTTFANAASAGLHVIIARLDLDRLASDLLKDTTTADIYRFKRDLAGALTTMVSGSGELMSVGQRHALLVVQSKNPYSIRLLAHQFSEGMRSLVADPPPLDNPTERTWRYPDGGKSIDEVIDSILE